MLIFTLITVVDYSILTGYQCAFAPWLRALPVVFVYKKPVYKKSWHAEGVTLDTMISHFSSHAFLSGQKKPSSYEFAVSQATFLFHNTCFRAECTAQNLQLPYILLPSWKEELSSGTLWKQGPVHVWRELVGQRFDFLKIFPAGSVCGLSKHASPALKRDCYGGLSRCLCCFHII